MTNMLTKLFEMGLHDLDIERTQATGIAGLSIVADSLAAIRDTKVKVIRNEEGLIVVLKEKEIMFLMEIMKILQMNLL